MPLSSGQILDNRYRIVSLLGKGGFGAVYLVWDTRLERHRALKENLDTSPETRRQFKREAQILDSLSHSSLPKVIDHFVIPNQGQYLVMEFVEGEDLGEMLQRVGGPLPEAQALEWIGQVCDALEYLHSQNPPIIHRDIKPANIKITLQGRAMLVDFGIAKVFDPKLSTTVGARAITPGYSPQEQYGTGTTDARTDVYALGATLYHLLTGVQPPESIQRNIDDKLAPPQALNPAVSDWVERAVLRAVELHPNQRFQSAKEFKAALTFIPSHNDIVEENAAYEQRTVEISDQIEASTARSRAMRLPTIWQRIPWRKVLGMLAVVAIAGVIVLGGRYISESGLYRKTTQTIVAQAIIPSATVKPAVTRTLVPVTVPTATITLLTTYTSTPAPTSVPTETFAPTDLPMLITDTNGIPMALVPAGSFIMGSEEVEENRYTSARPVHEVILDAFYIDIYEVTNARYAECVEAGKCETPGCAYFGKPEYDNHPVVCVDWSKALAFCQWRKARLPTEAEWEKAARGGLEGMSYPWGSDEPNCLMANYWNRSSLCKGRPVEVGSYAPNGYGLYDMAGNVWEWTNSLFKPYPYRADDGREDLAASGSRVMRGGSWYSYAIFCAYRYKGFEPNDTFDSYGFRCAHSP
jgi:formylglycine-generating enzyme required for sulfatase activity/tRNA A-37 threonylcarbamoyl transferase component Bud32